MVLSVIIPVYNERATVREIVRRVRAADNGFPKEIIVVDDGSTDGTREALKAPAIRDRGCDSVSARISDSILSRECGSVPGPDLRILLHDRNRGKGAALRTGFAAATGDIVLVQDADLEYDPAEYPRLLGPILDGRADVGSRFLGGPHRVLFFWHAVGNRILTTLCNMLSNLNLSDMETGYKVFRREILGRIRLNSDRFGFEPEVTVKVAKLHCRIYEVPISYSGRDYTEGKKIGWRDGLAALFHILRFRFFG